MLDTQIAYIAGLVDGEGSIGLYLKKGRKDFSLRLVIYNTDESVIDWLIIKAGGLKHKVGRIENRKHKQEYCWYLSGQKACDFLILLMPYLIIK